MPPPMMRRPLLCSQPACSDVSTPIRTRDFTARGVRPSPHTLSRGNWAFSRSRTSRPAFGRWYAVAEPDGPAPTTITSAWFWEAAPDFGVSDTEVTGPSLGRGPGPARSGLECRRVVDRRVAAGGGPGGERDQHGGGDLLGVVVAGGVQLAAAPAVDEGTVPAHGSGGEDAGAAGNRVVGGVRVRGPVPARERGMGEGLDRVRGGGVGDDPVVLDADQALDAL